MKWSKTKLLGRVSNRKAIISLMVVVALVATSTVTAVALSPQVASIESTTPELSILNMTHDPAEALVGESVVWTVVVEVQEPAQLGKGLLFTWDWDDGSYTVYHLKSLISEPIAVNVQTHAWSAAGVYDVVVSVYDGYGPQKSRFHNVSATTPFIVRDAEPNTPPVASFYLWPEEGTVDTVFMFNANSSYDFEDPVESLLVRWDWESDSVWDTNYSGDQAAEHQYAAAGDYLVTLEVMDTGGLTDTAWGNLTVVASTTLTPHDPIVIIGDTDFVPKNGVVRGAGTYDDPYVIAGWSITPAGGNGITVLGTTAYFTILNTQITGSIDTCTYGIYLNSVAHATLRGLTISGFWMGIHAVETADLTVTLCDVTWSSWGLFALRCGSIYVTENEISHNIVSTGNHEGIMVQETDYAYIASNDLVDNWDGVFLYIVSFGWIHNNTMRDNGIGIQALYSGCVVFGNSIASKVIGIILVDCPDTSVESNSITTDPSVYDSYTGIEFMSCSGLSLSLNAIDSYHIGIRTSPSSYAYPESDNVTISWNRISYCDVVAMSAYYVLDLTVTANTFLSSGTGIYVDSSVTRGKVYHNDFVGNSVQAQESLLCAGNEWDDGYPSGGNYWSDYGGVDSYSGVYQDEPGADGIGDTPYVLASGSQDNYPLMEPFASPNTAPTANFSISADPWEVGEVFEFDASSSWDYEDDLAELQVRWDWENDGAWDTPWSYDKIAYHIFEEAGEHFVALEVVDTGWLTGISVVGIYIPDDVEPTPPNTFYLPFATTDVVFDPERPYAYITDKYAMSLYFLNLTDGSVDKTFEFQYMTESLAMTPDGSRLFVALLTREHDPYWFDGHIGYIASIDLETQVKDREFVIDEDPFDLLATSNGQLVVSPGSGQWDYIRTYDATDGAPLGSAFIRHMSRLSMHPSESIVYAADTDVSPSDITRFDLSRSGDISLAGDSPYHGDYEMAGNVWVNPLGDSLIVRGGHVLTAGLPISEDMYYLTTMTTSLIADVEFDLVNGLVLSLEGSQLCWYDIESYEALGNTSTGSDMEFLGLSGGTVYCVDAEWSSTTIIWFDSVSA